jgi:hypothetical protein
MRPLTPKASFLKLQQFCLELGWEALLVMHRSPNELHVRQKLSLSRYFYTLYEVDSPIYVQINPQADQHPRLFAMNIYALRYGLCTGWHGFMIDRHQASELQHVWHWLHWSNFATQRSRRAFRKTNPKCTEYTWRRIRDSGPPYTQSSTFERWQACRVANQPMDTKRRIDRFDF